MSRRRVLMVGKGSLFGQGMGRILDAEGDDLQLEQVPTVEAAIEAAPRFRPDVVVFCSDRAEPRDEAALQRLRLMDAYPPRIVRCTLDASHLTIYETTRIRDATVDDLLAVVRRGPTEHDRIARDRHKRAEGGEVGESGVRTLEPGPLNGTTEEDV